MGAANFVFNQREVARGDLVHSGGRSHTIDCVVTPNGRAWLKDFTGAYLRLMDYRYLPEVEAGTGGDLLAHATNVHMKLAAWANTSRSRVVNPPASMLSNASKPFQAQLLRANGFRVPDTVVTDDPNVVAEFAHSHPQPIYKSISSNRSIVRRLSRESWRRLADVSAVPTQFQEYIPGIDVRVHVVGPQHTATAIYTDAVDYRYAARDGLDVRMEAFDELPELGARCVAFASALALPLAGFDFRVTTDGTAFCLEVNPMPMFSFYEERAGQRIAELIAMYIIGESRS